ncbi:hypothetical protein FKM82_024494 [Ascaphus truei]
MNPIGHSHPETKRTHGTATDRTGSDTNNQKSQTVEPEVKQNTQSGGDYLFEALFFTYLCECIYVYAVFEVVLKNSTLYIFPTYQISGAE